MLLHLGQQSKEKIAHAAVTIKNSITVTVLLEIRDLPEISYSSVVTGSYSTDCSIRSALY